MKVTEGMIVSTLSHFDHTHNIIEDLFWKAQIEKRQKGIDGGTSLQDLQVIKENLRTLKSDFLSLLSNRNYSIKLVENSLGALNEKA